MTNEMMDRVKALMEDDSFDKEIENLETAEELQKALEARGVEITVQEVEEICVGITSKKGTELGEDDLDNVSGGGILLGCALIAAGWAVSYGAGYVAGKILKKKSGVCN